jgi:hypothetical protein
MTKIDVINNVCIIRKVLSEVLFLERVLVLHVIVYHQQKSSAANQPAYLPVGHVMVTSWKI